LNVLLLRISLIGLSSKSDTSITNLTLLGVKDGVLKIKDPEPFKGNPTTIGPFI